MALVFKTSEELNVELGRTNGDVENLGLVSAYFPKGSRVKFGKSNLAKKDKLVTLVITMDVGGVPKFAFLPCSASINSVVREGLSKGMEKKKMLRWLISLEVVKNAKGEFISRAMGDAEEGIKIEDLKKVAEFVPEELIAW